MAKKTPPKQSSGLIHALSVLAALALTGFFFAGSAVFLLICLIPTFIAFFVDRNLPRTLGVTVGAANLTGAVPRWLEVVEANHDPVFALNLALQPMTLLMAYAAAAIGWIIYLAATRFVALVVVSKAEMRIQRLLKQEQNLVERWGPEIKKQ